jgi:formate dehydrogenase subunit gamma
MTTTEPQPGRTVAEVVTDTVAALEGQRGALLPILHAIQEKLGCVPREAVPVLAERLNLSRADVHGVVTFYHDFRAEPAGRTTVKICRAEACQAVGSSRLVDHVRDRYGMELGETRSDGALTVDQVFCLGNCALGPTVQVGARLHGRVDAAKLTDLIDSAMAS